MRNKVAYIVKGGVSLISLKDYAKEKNISYEAVRKQVVRYRKDLEGHIKKIDRTNYLDEEAVEFLDNKRSKNPVVIIESSKDEEIKKLKDENKNLLLRVNKLQDMLIKEKDTIKLLQEEKIASLKEKEKKSWWEMFLKLKK